MPTIPPASPNTLLRYNAAGELETVSLSEVIEDLASSTAPTSPALGEWWVDVSALTVPTPTFSPAAGAYISGQTIAILCADPSATIHYTTDGSTPTTGSPTYSTPVELTTATTIKALAVRSGWYPAAVTSAAYTVSTSLIANPGFETQGAGDSTTAESWVLAASVATTVRIGTDNGIAPYAGSWMLKTGCQSYDPVSSSNAYQTITGDAYRLSAGTLSVRTNLYSPASIGDADANREVYLTVLAYAADGTTVLGRVDIRIAGNFDASLGAQPRSSAQRVTLTSGSWQTCSIDVRTSLDAALGADLANVATVRVYLRGGSKSGGAFTLYWDSVAF
jgi:hypothetical protein